MAQSGESEPLEFDERLIAWTSSTMRRLDLQYMDMDVRGMEVVVDGPTDLNLALVLSLTWPAQGVHALITFLEPEEWGASAHVRLGEGESGSTVHHCDYVQEESTWNLMFGTVALYIRTRQRPIVRFSTAG